MVFAITASFIVLDIISGAVKAFTKKQWDSSKMREGLWHKMGFVLIIALAILCDYGQNFLELGFTIPVTTGVCIYVITTEIGSIIENVAIINPEMLPGKIKSIFIKVKEGEK